MFDPKDILSTTLAQQGLTTVKGESSSASGQQQSSIASAKPVLPRPELFQQVDSAEKPLQKRPCVQLTPPSDADLKKELRKIKKRASAHDSQLRKKTRQEELETLLRDNIPGWHPGLIYSTISVKNPLKDKTYVMAWLKAKYPKADHNSLSILTDQLQSKAKLTGPLRFLKRKLDGTCSAFVFRNRKNAYINRLEKAAKPYLGLLKPKTEVKEAGTSEQSPMVSEAASFSMASGSGVLSHQGSREKPDPQLMETDTLIFGGLTKTTKEIRPALTVPMPAPEVPRSREELQRIHRRGVQQEARQKQQEEKLQLQNLACSLNPGLTPEKIMASVTITPSYSDSEFLLQFLQRNYPNEPGLISRTVPEQLPMDIHDRFKKVCSAEDSRRRTKMYLETLDRIISQSLSQLSTLSATVDTSGEPDTMYNSDDSEATLTASECSPSPSSTLMLPGDEIRARVLRDDHCIKQWIINGQGYYINDSMPYVTYLIDPQIRAALLSETLRENLKTPKRWNIGYFRFDSDQTELSKMTVAMQRAKEPSKDNSVLVGQHWLSDHETPFSELVEVTVQKATADKKKHHLSLQPRGLMIPDGTLALFNHSTDQSVTVQLGNNKTMDLSPAEGLFLKMEDPQAKSWKPVGHYHNGKKLLDTNPLLRDHGPVVAKGRHHAIDSSDTSGELFLHTPALADLAARQSQKAGCLPPAVCMTATNVKAEFRKFAKSPLPACSLITGLDGANHFVPVRLIKSPGQVLVYIHETLSQNNPVTCQIQQMILKAAHEQFKDMNIYFLTPQAETQRDFSTCGVSVLKALRAFDKQSEPDNWLPLDRWLLKAVTEHPGCQSKIQADKKNFPVPVESRIPLEKMHPLLLKIYQGKLSKLDRKQLDAFVSHIGKANPVTLESYITGYQREVASLLRKGETSTPNFAGYCKRYKYLLKWEEMYKPVAPSLPETTTPAPKPTPAPISEESRVKAVAIREKLLLIKDIGTLKQANQYLKKNFTKVPPVTKDEWDKMLAFEKLVLADKKRTKKKPGNSQLLAFHGWLEELHTATDEAKLVHNELLKLWLEHILESPETEPQWKNRPLAEVPAMLLAMIDESGSDRPSRPSRKRPREPSMGGDN